MHKARFGGPFLWELVLQRDCKDLDFSTDEDYRGEDSIESFTEEDLNVALYGEYEPTSESERRALSGHFWCPVWPLRDKVYAIRAGKKSEC